MIPCTVPSLEFMQNIVMRKTFSEGQCYGSKPVMRKVRGEQPDMLELTI